MKNVKQVKIVLDDIGLRVFKTTPAFYNLIHKNQADALTVGDNIVPISHYNYGRLFNLGNSSASLNQVKHISVEEI